ncbi:MAG: 50S ribosomal protein L11 methyltransferase [FCB group bacterium]|nr:50S ribosomal protein L11 methyltransferase [FCB group bacterium]
MVNLILSVDGQSMDELSDLCLSLGAQSVTAIPGARDETWYHEPGEHRNWKTAVLHCLMNSEADGHALIRALEIYSGLSFGHEFTPVPNRDWVQYTRDQFQPELVADYLWLLPPWTPVKQYPEPRLIIEPGLAFGTGAHPTTRMILRWLCQNPPSNQSVIDWGCGSGILALAALKLGARNVLGTDIDLQAITASRNNAELNQLPFPTYLPSEMPTNQVKLILANILANPLIELAPVFANYSEPEGQLLLTGILEPQIDAVNSAYQPWYHLEKIDQDEDWVLLRGTRRA